MLVLFRRTSFLDTFYVLYFSQCHMLQLQVYAPVWVAVGFIMMTCIIDIVLIELCSLKCGEKVREKREREKEVSDNCMDIVWCWLSNLFIMRIFEWWETQCFKWNQRNWWHLWLQRTNISCLAKCTFHQRHVDDWKKDN